MIKKIINEIYETCGILKDLSRSIFVALPKKPGSKKYDRHGTIDLISYVAKLIIGILTNALLEKLDWK